jgi:hypothetical protein
MPDFFGVILFITTWLLLFARLGRTHTVICIALLTYSILVHNAHLFLFLGVAAIYLMLVLFTKASLIPIKRIGLLVSIVIALAFSTAFLVNTGFGRNTVFGGSSHLFLTSRLNETGILHEFLERKCGSTDYPLCTYKDSLTGDYLWDPKSPMHKIGGVQADKSGYDHMLGDMITDPHTVKRILVMALNSTVLQFFSFEIEPHNPLRLSYIKERFAVHRHDMDISFQNRGNRLDFKSLNDRQWAVVLTSMVLLLVLLIFSKNLPIVVRNSIWFLFLFLWINAFLFGSLSTVLARYQGRIIALVPFMLMFWMPDIAPLLKRVIMSAFQKAEDQVTSERNTV